MRAPPQSQPASPTPAAPVAAVLRGGSRIESLLALQRTAGNAATGAYLARQTVTAPEAPPSDPAAGSSRRTPPRIDSSRSPAAARRTTSARFAPPRASALVHDADPRIASAARRALHGQRRSAAWRAVVERLASDSSQPELAATASGWLAET
jgi:hypothetical protein